MNEILASLKASRKTSILFPGTRKSVNKICFFKFIFKNKMSSKTTIKKINKQKKRNKKKSVTGISEPYTHFQTKVVLSFNIN